MMEDFEDLLELFASCWHLLGTAVAALLFLWFFLYLPSLRTHYSLKGKHIQHILEFFGLTPLKRDQLHNPSSHEELREALTKNDVDPNARNSEQNALIHSMVIHTIKGKKQKKTRMQLLVTLLTFADVDIELKNGDGHTALHLAVMSGDPKSIKALMAFGANVNALSFANQTPLDLLKEPHRELSMCSHNSKPLQRLSGKRKSQPVSRDSNPIPPHSKTCNISCTLEKGTSLDHMSAKRVDKLTGILKSAGAKQKRDVHKSSLPMKPVRVPSSMSTKRSWKSPEESRNILIDSCLEYNFLVKELVTRRLSVIRNAKKHKKVLSNGSMLLRHMQEARMLQMAGSRILFLDGGGMRGLIQIEILSQIEKMTGKHITELFDWIVGTSVGGVLALGIVYGKKSLVEMRQILFKAREDVFKARKGGLSCPTKVFEEILIGTVGINSKMKDITHPKVIVPATHKESVNLKLHLFSNVFEDKLNNELVWKVGRYTSAAPIYFTEMDNYVDGGILAQNPSSTVLTSIHNYYYSRNQKLPISMVVSIGSGHFPDDDIGNINVTEYLHLGKHWLHILSGLSSRVKSLTKLISRAVTESETVSENCRCHCMEQGIQYFRFNPKTSQLIEPCESDLSILLDMILAARYSTIENCSFHQMILMFEKVRACRKQLMHSSYDEKVRNIKGELKNT